MKKCDKELSHFDKAKLNTFLFLHQMCRNYIEHNVYGVFTLHLSFMQRFQPLSLKSYSIISSFISRVWKHSMIFIDFWWWNPFWAFYWFRVPWNCNAIQKSFNSNRGLESREISCGNWIKPQAQSTVFTVSTPHKSNQRY